MNKRDSYIDLCRAGAVSLVIIQHCGFPGIGRIILSFHMPLFFVITGMTIKLSNQRNKSTQQYVNKRIRQLILPYFEWETVVLLITFVLALLDVKNYHLDFMSAMKSIIFCLNIDDYSAVIPRLWFLPTSAISSCLAFTIIKLVDNKVMNSKNSGGGNCLLIAICLIDFAFFALLYYARIGRMIFTFDISLFALVYVLLGYISLESMQHVRERSRTLKCVLFLVAAMFWLTSCFRNQSLFLMYRNSYGELLNSFLSSLCGCFVYFIGCDFINDFIGNFGRKHIKWLNTNSIEIFPVHLIIISLLRLYLDSIADIWVRSSLTFILCVVFLVICISFTNILKDWVIGHFHIYSDS